jgi:hypothetical protein
MEPELPPQPRGKPPLRRILAAALSGGLGVFGLAVDASQTNTAVGSAPPAANVSPVDPSSD